MQLDTLIGMGQSKLAIPRGHCLSNPCAGKHAQSDSIGKEQWGQRPAKGIHRCGCQAGTGIVLVVLSAGLPTAVDRGHPGV